MDLAGKIVAGLIALWAVAMVVGLLIAIAPLLLFVAGFFLMIGLLTLIGRLVGSWFLY
jgi:hypothetical protein